MVASLSTSDEHREPARRTHSAGGDQRVFLYAGHLHRSERLVTLEKTVRLAVEPSQLASGV
jgi:hypothetical protein